MSSVVVLEYKMGNNLSANLYTIMKYYVELEGNMPTLDIKWGTIF